MNNIDSYKSKPIATIAPSSEAKTAAMIQRQRAISADRYRNTVLVSSSENRDSLERVDVGSFLSNCDSIKDSNLKDF